MFSIGNQDYNFNFRARWAFLSRFYTYIVKALLTHLEEGLSVEKNFSESLLSLLNDKQK